MLPTADCYFRFDSFGISRGPRLCQRVQLERVGQSARESSGRSYSLSEEMVVQQNFEFYSLFGLRENARNSNRGDSDSIEPNKPMTLIGTTPNEHLEKRAISR